MRLYLSFFLVFISPYLFAQIGNRVVKTYDFKEQITFHNTAISPVQFEIRDGHQQILDANFYKVDFNTATIHFFQPIASPITITYFKYPDFLTQTYTPISEKLIFPNTSSPNKQYITQQLFNKEDFLGDLQTYGNITRGITVGNQQGNVLNSGLDLQIVGKLSEQLSIRASIKDSNLPLQENGVSQNIQEFDRVFMELFTDRWNVKAGDIDIVNSDSFFLKFNKKITGANVNVHLKNENTETLLSTSGALVKGKFNRQTLTPLEGNQGPYLLKGSNGEVNIVVLSGSESVFVNGILLKRGEQEDYVIDYQTAQIIFNTTFPISNTQRIVVEFQYNDRNYNRFVTYNSAVIQNDRWKIGTYFYNENDLKNQPLDSNFSDTQKNILLNAGNDTSKMFSENAIQSKFDENSILYKKVISGAQSYYEFSNNASDELFKVQFSNVGTNKGNYVLKESIAIGNIYEYVGNNAGSYEPITILVAPNKNQIVAMNTTYQLNKNSEISAETAYSINDQNLFSSIDDQNNNGIAAKIAWNYQNVKPKQIIKNKFKLDFIQQQFKSVERLYKVDFSRDWNIGKTVGNQLLVENSIHLQSKNQNQTQWTSSMLNLGQNFRGFLNEVKTHHQLDSVLVTTQSSLLHMQNSSEKGYFYKNHTQIKHHHQKYWSGIFSSMEKNDFTNHQNQQKNIQNFQLLKSGFFLGKGDSTNVYHQFNYYHMVTDSIFQNLFTKLQQTNNYGYNAQLIKNDLANMTVFMNYKNSQHRYNPSISVLNSQFNYSQSLFKKIVRLNTFYETSTGTTPQQNFVYIETEVGQGYYTYLGDLNNNGLKDFDEFEVAKFTDQANYLRVLLPNNSLVATQKYQWRESVMIHFNQFENAADPFLQWISKFANQSNYFINHQQLKNNHQLVINPFNSDSNKVIQLQQSFNSVWYFNRNLQKYNVTYEYTHSKNKQTLSGDLQTNNQQIHQITFRHLFFNIWQANCELRKEFNNNQSEQFSSRNFYILSQWIKPGIRLIKNDNNQISANYLYKKVINQIGSEDLIGQEISLSYEKTVADKLTLLSNLNFIQNQYQGATQSPAAYRILEGLQPGANFTWSLIVQKKLTSLLDLQINYQGRKNQNTQTIHIGSVQLRANF